MKLASRKLFAVASAIAALTSAASLHAVTIDFAGNGGLKSASGDTAGASYTFTSGTVTVTATAWYSNNAAPTGPVLGAKLGQYDKGLGVTNPNDGGHVIDNIGTFDLVRLSFNQVVNVSSFRLEYVGSDSDIQVFYGASNTPGTLYSGAFIHDTTNSGSDRDANVVASAQYFLIGASTISPYAGNDEFKLRSVTFTVPTNTPGVPDGGSTVLLLGSAIAALGLVARRRKVA